MSTGYLFKIGTCHDPGTFDSNTWAHSYTGAHLETLGYAVSLRNSVSKARRTICEGFLFVVLTGYLFVIGERHDPATFGWNTWRHSYKEAHLETLG